MVAANPCLGQSEWYWKRAAAVDASAAYALDEWDPKSAANLYAEDHGVLRRGVPGARGSVLRRCVPGTRGIAHYEDPNHLLEGFCYLVRCKIVSGQPSMFQAAKIKPVQWMDGYVLGEFVPSCHLPAGEFLPHADCAAALRQALEPEPFVTDVYASTRAVFDRHRALLESKYLEVGLYEGAADKRVLAAAQTKALEGTSTLVDTLVYPTGDPRFPPAMAHDEDLDPARIEFEVAFTPNAIKRVFGHFRECSWLGIDVEAAHVNIACYLSFTGSGFGPLQAIIVNPHRSREAWELTGQLMRDLLAS